jgi:hypothetical protein
MRYFFYFTSDTSSLTIVFLVIHHGIYENFYVYILQICKLALDTAVTAKCTYET